VFCDKLEKRTKVLPRKRESEQKSYHEIYREDTNSPAPDCLIVIFYPGSFILFFYCTWKYIQVFKYKSSLKHINRSGGAESPSCLSNELDFVLLVKVIEGGLLSGSGGLSKKGLNVVEIYMKYEALNSDLKADLIVTLNTLYLF
jgi:hypothetical protein